MINEILEGLTSKLKNIGEKKEPTLEIPSDEQQPSSTIPDTLPTPSLPAPTGDGENLPTPEDLSELLGGGTEELENKVKILEDKATKLDNTVAETLKIAKDNNDRLSNMEGNMRKFLSLYELVTNQVNPFVESPTPRKQLVLVGGGEPPVEPEIEPPLEVPKVNELEKEEQLIQPQPENLISSEEKPEPIAPPVVEEPVVTLPVDSSDPTLPKDIDQTLMPKPPEPVPTPQTVSESTGQAAPTSPQKGEQFMFMQSVKDGHANFAVEWITNLLGDKNEFHKNTQLLKYLFDMGWITPKAYESLTQHMDNLVQAEIPQASVSEQKAKVKIPILTGMNQPANNNLNVGPVSSGLPQNMDSMMTVINWVQDLVNNVGNQQAGSTVEYLHKMGWLTEDAYNAMISYIQMANPAQQANIPQQTFQQNQQVQQPRPQYVQQQPHQQPPQQPQQPVGTPQTDSKQLVPLEVLGSDIESLAIVLEWIRYSVDKAGITGSKKMFQYYLDIGWINQPVHDKLNKYIDGIKAPAKEPKDYESTVEDHATTLFFISKLKHMKLTKEDIGAILGG